MSTENENALDREANDSDDGFEVLDPEPEQEPDDFKYLSRTEFKNPGTIIFCHMEDEIESIHNARCHYIRPEGWTEQEQDEIAIFEVGWINTEEAVARLPVDLTISSGYPLGSVNLKDFSFRKEDYTELPGAVSHFQFCYLRDGVLLGASTPFGIRGIKAVGRIPLMRETPIFLPCGQFAADGDPAAGLYGTTNNLSVFETSAVSIPSYKHNHDKFFVENEAVQEMSEGSVGVELCTLQNTLRSLGALTKRLQSRNVYDKTRTSEYTAELILQLRESVDELSAEMLKASDGLPSTSMIPPSPASCDDLEQRFRSCAAQLKANLQDCTRTFDLCKVAIKNQTPPSSLSVFERSDLVREDEWKRQQQFEELKQLQDEVRKFKEELLLNKTDPELKKQLEDAGTELKTVKEELSAKELNNSELRRQLLDMEAELKTIKEERSLMKNDQHDLMKKLTATEHQLVAVNEELCLRQISHQQLKMHVQETQEMMSKKEKDMKSQMDDIGKQRENLIEEMSLKGANHENYVAEVEKEKKQTEVKMKALTEESTMLRSQIQSLLEEAKLYKSKLGDTIMELTSTRREADSLKEQCTKFVHELNFMEDEKVRLNGYIAVLKEELEKKGQTSDPVANAKHDILIQEFLKKSDELNVAHQQVENFQDELSRLNVQRTALQKELLEARQKPAKCEKPCCTFEITPDTNLPDQVVASILESLEQSLQQNSLLQQKLDTEKLRSAGLEEKLQTAAGKHRSLYMEKITLETRVKELLGSN